MRHYRWTQNTLFEFAEKPFAHLDQNTLSTPRGHSKDTQRTHVGEHPGVPDVLSIAIFGVIRVHMDSSHMNGIAESIHGVQRAYWNNWRFFCPAAVRAKLQQLSVQTLLWWRSIKGYGSWLTPSSCRNCRLLCPANVQMYTVYKKAPCQCGWHPPLADFCAQQIQLLLSSYEIPLASVLSRHNISKSRVLPPSPMLLNTFITCSFCLLFTELLHLQEIINM